MIHTSQSGSAYEVGTLYKAYGSFFSSAAGSVVLGTGTTTQLIPGGPIGLNSVPGTVSTSTFVNFTPSSIAAFTFQPTLAGTQYNATVTFNVFGQRYYLTLTDVSGNTIVCRSITASGPQFQSSLSWDDGIATATMDENHNVPLGSVVSLRVSQTGTIFDGIWNALAVSQTILIYQLIANPNKPIPLTGNVDFPLNLVAGYGPGFLAFHFETQQFEVF